MDAANKAADEAWQNHAEVYSRVEGQLKDGASAGVGPRQMGTPMQPYTRPGGTGMVRPLTTSKPTAGGNDGDIEKQLIAFRDEQRKKGVPDSQIRALLADEYKKLTGNK
jgi:hypothetical protein